MTKRCIFAPGPSYNPETAEQAGWVHILTRMHEALEAEGYEVIVPIVDLDLVGTQSSFERCLSYSLLAVESTQRLKADLIVSAPSYGCALFAHHPEAARLAYVWNNGDAHRRLMLEPEYARFGVPYPVRPLDEWTNTLGLRFADHLLACSPFVVGTWAEQFDRHRISLAFWGVDSEQFTPATAPPARFTVLWVGSDYVRKGLIYVLQAMEQAFPQGEADLIVAGIDVQVQATLPFPVDLRGPVPYAAMPALMQQATVLCCPTLEDGIALVVQEATATGLVPLATPDASEVFQHRVSGFRVPFRASDDLAVLLRWLYEHPEARQGMAQAARALAERQTWEQFQADFREVVRRVQRDQRNAVPFSSAMPWLGVPRGT